MHVLEQQQDVVGRVFDLKAEEHDSRHAGREAAAFVVEVRALGLAVLVPPRQRPRLVGNDPTGRIDDDAPAGLDAEARRVLFEHV